MVTILNINNAAALLIFSLFGVLIEINSSEASSLMSEMGRNIDDGLPEALSSSDDDLFSKENPEYMLRMFTRLRQAYNGLLDGDSWSYSKRGLDLGLGRGFSGSQAAKHRMGMAVASFAGGPGRRRRNGKDA